jgi:hypothetical protein
MTETKLQRAVAVRDAVLPWLREHCTVEPTAESGSGKVVHGKIDRFDIYYQAPCSAACDCRQPPCIVGLYIPGCMTFEWTDDGRSYLAFRADKWDAALLRALDKQGVPL